MDTFVAELDEEMHGINKVVVVLLVVVAMRVALGARAREGEPAVAFLGSFGRHGRGANWSSCFSCWATPSPKLTGAAPHGWPLGLWTDLHRDHLCK